MEHHDAAPGLPLHEGDRVQIGKGTRHNLLFFPERSDCLDAVAQQRGTLEFQLLGCLHHAFFQLMQQLFGVALQKRNAFPHERGVLLRRNPARARGKTPPEMLIEAGAFFSNIAREYPAAGLELQRLRNGFNHTVCKLAARIRTEIAVGVRLRLGDNRKLPETAWRS